MSKCPICKKEMKEWHDTLDGWCVMEDGHSCPSGHYMYMYATGTTEIVIGNKSFGYYYTASKNKIRFIEWIANLYLYFYKIYFVIGGENV